MPVFFQNNRIAELIRTGLTMDVDESEIYWLGRDQDGQCFACAIGMAMIGRMGVFRANVAFIESLRENGGDEIQTISELLEIAPIVITEISRLHQMGVSAAEIAEALECEEGEDQFDLFTVSP
jgi:hypothetical protein